MFKWKWILIALVLSILFAQGCKTETEEPSTPLSFEQLIKKTRNDINELEDFERKLNEQGFVKSHSSSNKIGDNVTFSYSVFRKDEVGYVHIEFTDESKANDELNLDFDTNETDKPRIIHSDGLNSSNDDPYRFQPSSGLDKQWIGIYFEGKKADSIPKGAIVLSYGSESWRSHY
ncbi:hypothetical protein [Brevibacillus centrosporus]|uniref:hypothetical protein n=1 Tax=Brevibacillus centrosporus TaxID=54910 RepID=UPI002E1C1FFD|nr:hypothetical protein [Brevibacillus centrosporus]